ncbi:hypothetical protein AYO21_11137 [Fonsecaea monophora]|uniref:SnoaL-like domain-containing protein n=1 Tax=Fonsecaea monophora TaxID=254056 RepID=A0A177EUF9_9EURO|nr:hypothetical protein AYO21_11137 [Fonsecaea monophora]OAG34702.1 hypothetical protein AYO21_11137 [Fonsecaea monophora]
MSDIVKSKKGRSEWHYLGDLTTLDNLHSTLPFPLSAYHKPELRKEEEEIFEHYVRWMEFNDHRFATNPEEGAEFYDGAQVLYYDLMGLIPRGRFVEHFYHIGPYFAKSHIGYKDMEIIATAPDFGFCNMEQHYYGVSTDGHKFDFKFRYTGLLKKRDGVWRWIQEHVSFPANIATQMADFTCSQDAGEHLRMKDEDNKKREELDKAQA